MLENVLLRLERKVDKLDDRLDSVDRTLVKQEQNLQEHMRRTDLLEKQHEVMFSSFNRDLEPLTLHVNQVKGVGKFIAFVMAAIAATATVYSLI